MNEQAPLYYEKRNTYSLRNSKIAKFIASAITASTLFTSCGGGIEVKNTKIFTEIDYDIVIQPDEKSSEATIQTEFPARQIVLGVLPFAFSESMDVKAHSADYSPSHFECIVGIQHVINEIEPLSIEDLLSKAFIKDCPVGAVIDQETISSKDIKRLKARRDLWNRLSEAIIDAIIEPSPSDQPLGAFFADNVGNTNFSSIVGVLGPIEYGEPRDNYVDELNMLDASSNIKFGPIDCILTNKTLIYDIGEVDIDTIESFRVGIVQDSSIMHSINNSLHCNNGQVILYRFTENNNIIQDLQSASLNIKK